MGTAVGHVHEIDPRAGGQLRQRGGIEADHG